MKDVREVAKRCGRHEVTRPRLILLTRGRILANPSAHTEPPDDSDLARLRDALKDSYRVDREVGEGGAATVYLAHDIKHERHVAIKVFKPELAETLGAER